MASDPCNTAVPVICLDGPGGSGKSTLAARVAQMLGWHCLDSGALYRAVAALAIDRGIDVEDARGVAALVASAEVAPVGAGPGVSGEFAPERLRSERVGRSASTIAAHPLVRRALLARQRAARQPPGLVAEGRDMGTVVFAQAPLKVFLDATPEVRAERRTKQLKNKGLNVSFRTLLAAIQERDARDRERAAAPLRPAADAIVIDSTALGFDEVVDRVLALARERGLGAVEAAHDVNKWAIEPET